MIHEAAHKLESYGFSIVAPINDQDGAIGYGVERDGEKFVVVAKEYAFKGLASFMESLVKKAAQSGMNLVFYEGRTDEFTVFDGKYYSTTAALSEGKSKTRNTRWLELTLDDGVSLPSYIRDGKQPVTMAGDNSTLGSFQ